MLYSTGAGYYARAIRKWLVMLVDEIDDMTSKSEMRKSVKRGNLREAMEELRRVLILANMDDLADRAIEIIRRLDELTGRIMVREGLYYQAMYIESVRHEIRELLEDVKKRTRKL